MNQLDKLELLRLCEEGTEESLRLEFKLCDELRPGTTYWSNGKKEERTLESTRTKLSKDISAFLNSAGGTIIDGIKGSDSRTKALDTYGAFTEGSDRRVESRLQSIRSIIQPAPAVNVYRIFDSDLPESSCYL